MEGILIVSLVLCCKWAVKTTVHQPQARTNQRREQGDHSAYFLKNHSRGDELSLAPLVSTNTKSLSTRLRQRLGSKAVCTGTFFRGELLKNCLAKCQLYQLKCLTCSKNL